MIADFVRRLREQHAPLLVMLAGPNGAGKSTFYTHYLAAQGLPFLNADLIARELAFGRGDAVPDLVPAAAGIAAERRRELVARKASFILETVFSDPAGDKVAFLRQAQQQGYAIVLVFIGLESAKLSSARVADRVSRGGHDVPPDKLRERFPRTLKNLAAALEFVDFGILFDNSRADEPYRFVATFERGALLASSGFTPRWASFLGFPTTPPG